MHTQLHFGNEIGHLSYHCVGGVTVSKKMLHFGNTIGQLSYHYAGDDSLQK